MEKKEKTYRISGSLPCKILAFAGLVVAGVICVISAILVIAAIECDAFASSKEKAVGNAMYREAYNLASQVWEGYTYGEEEELRQRLEDAGAEAMIVSKDRGKEKIVWVSTILSEGDMEAFQVQTDIHWYDAGVRYAEELSEGISIREEIPEDAMSDSRRTISIRIFQNPGLASDGETRLMYEIASFVYDLRHALIWTAVISALVWLMCIVFLLYAAGHRSGVSEIVPGVFTKIYFDVFTFIVFLIVCIICAIMAELSYELSYGLGAGWVFCGSMMLFMGVCGEIIAMLYLMDLAIRMKLKKLWKGTLVYVLFKKVGRLVVRGCRLAGRLLKGLPLVLNVMIAFLALVILEFFGVTLFVDEPGVVLWFLEKVVLFFVILYTAVVCRKLYDAGKGMAQGKTDCTVDTSHMLGSLKEHGENLNSIEAGISKAVEERMKSEHLKTELITNVSHDLKTPLTSIINYADIICKEECDNPKIAEYSEVLFRQSQRLKKLLEDLIEASKANTGDVEIHPEKMDVGVLLTQIAGEFQQKLEEKDLDLRMSQPEEPVMIMADSRRLWRVFDNLMNNICKYSREDSRVYLSLEVKEEHAVIIFRNMSKYALNVGADELSERFVRGDKSRHMEGNGLGLSIARSLTELQGGQMEIVVDGDLFKVVLRFPGISEL